MPLIWAVDLFLSGIVLGLGFCLVTSLHHWFLSLYLVLSLCSDLAESFFQCFCSTLSFRPFLCSQYPREPSLLILTYCLFHFFSFSLLLILFSLFTSLFTLTYYSVLANLVMGSKERSPLLYWTCLRSRQALCAWSCMALALTELLWSRPGMLSCLPHAHQRIFKEVFWGRQGMLPYLGGLRLLYRRGKGQT